MAWVTFPRLPIPSEQLRPNFRVQEFMGTFEQVGRFSDNFIGFMSLHILDHQINSNVRLCANHSGVWQNTPPLRPGKKSRDPSATFGTPELLQATKLSAKDSQISHLWQTFCSLSNPWQIFKLCCESRLGASDTHSWAKIYQQLSNQSSTWDHAPHSLAGDVELRAGGFGFNKSQITGSSARYFCKPVLHSILVSYRKHLHLE